jgi:FixJ family two-component response regulator
VALVDDYPSVREALTLVLEQAGFAVFAFGTGEEFLAAAESIEPACALIDIGLPGLTGFDLLQTLGGAASRFPVILITGSNDQAFPIHAAEAGARGSIQKPFDAEAVVGKVLAALEN